MSKEFEVQAASGRQFRVPNRGTTLYFSGGTPDGYANADGSPKNGTASFLPRGIWFNIKNNGRYTNVGTFTSSQWVLDDASSGSQVQVGNALQSSPLAAMFAEGSLIHAIAGAPAAANGADTTDDILGGIQLPANAFDISGRQLTITAQGQFGATGNNKRFRVFVNPTITSGSLASGIYGNAGSAATGSGQLLFDSGTITTNTGMWWFQTTITKYGAAASNTQNGFTQWITTTTHQGLTSLTSLTQSETAAMNIVVTGASQTTGAASDIVANLIQFTWAN